MKIGAKKNIANLFQPPFEKSIFLYKYDFQCSPSFTRQLLGESPYPAKLLGMIHLEFINLSPV